MQFRRVGRTCIVAFLVRLWLACGKKTKGIHEKKESKISICLQGGVNKQDKGFGANGKQPHDTHIVAKGWQEAGNNAMKNHE